MTDTVPSHDVKSSTESTSEYASAEASSQGAASNSKERRLSGIVETVGLFVSKGYDENVNTSGAEFPASNIVTIGSNEFLQSNIVIQWLNTKFSGPETVADAFNEHLVRILYKDTGLFDVYCLRVRYSEDGARTALEECTLMSGQRTVDYTSAKDVIIQLPSAVSTIPLYICIVIASVYTV